jgi:hypothetical protein
LNSDDLPTFGRPTMATIGSGTADLKAAEGMAAKRHKTHKRKTAGF